MGKSIKTKVIAHLGPYREFIEKDAPSLLRRLSRLTGQEIEEVVYEKSHDAEDVLTILLLWEELGLSEIFKGHLIGNLSIIMP